MLNHLFVYGTLRKAQNGKLHPYLKDLAIFIDHASLPGKLFQIAHYPGALPAPARSGYRIHGEVYRLLRPELTLSILDEYEECSDRFPRPHEYRRTPETATLSDGKNITAWMYWYCRPTSGFRQIDSGDYFDHLVTTTLKPSPH